MVSYQLEAQKEALENMLHTNLYKKQEELKAVRSLNLKYCCESLKTFSYIFPCGLIVIDGDRIFCH